ncbi:MAG TPA: hypothetical protein VHV51_01545, partial [Polyangiaceae bacterium]|nr:hypothetical protein [Polyangiaceae bacterium]
MRLNPMPLLWVLLAAFSSFVEVRASAAENDAPLVLHSAPDLSAFVERPISRIEFVTQGGRWASTPALEHARVGQLLSSDLVRRALEELGDTGR